MNKKVHIVKNRKQSLPRLKIHIKYAVVLLAVTALLYTCSVSIATVAGVYIGYMVLRLVMRLFALLTATVYTVISILVLLLIISLIII